MKNEHKLFNLAAILLFALVLTVVPHNVASAMEGNGTSQSPYLISTVEDFDQISSRPYAYYQITNDLDFQNVERTSIPEFTGTLDGAGFTLSNLNLVDNGNCDASLISILRNGTIKNFTIANSKSTYTSQFGSAVLVVGFVTESIYYGNSLVDGITVIDSEVYSKDSAAAIAGNNSASIKNCNVINTTVVGASRVGAICFMDDSATISNCHVIGGELKAENDSNSNSYIGGIGSYGYYSKITNCSVKDTKISSTMSSKKSYVGGITGYAYSTKYTNCSSTANIYAENGSAGGMNGGGSDCTFTECYSEGIISASFVAAGFMAEGYASITNCYANNTLINTNSVAGIGAGFSNNSTSIIKNSYCSSTIDAPIIFPIGASNSITNSYFNKDILQIQTPETQARSQEQMYQQSNYEGWNFDTIWIIDDGMDYPKLRNTN